MLFEIVGKITRIETIEDYLYPQAYFSKVHLSRKAQEAVTV